MRIALLVSSLLFGAYTTLTAVEIAQTGLNAGIQQLVAAGGAESLCGLLAVIGGVTLFVRWWLSFSSFVLGALWCVCIAVFYMDDTVWLWLAAFSVLAAFVLWIHRLRIRIATTSKASLPDQTP